MSGEYVYIRSEPGLWTVGFYGPDDKWEPDSDYDSPVEAAARVRYLNGGIVSASADSLSRRVAELEGALRDAREYLMNSPYRASDTSGKEWNRVMDVSGAALKGKG